MSRTKLLENEVAETVSSITINSMDDIESDHRFAELVRTPVYSMIVLESLIVEQSQFGDFSGIYV